MDPTLDNARNFVAQVWRIGSWTGELPPPTSLPFGAARSMSRLALAHPAMDDRWQPDAALRLFGPTDDAELGKLRGQSLGFLLSSTLALAMTQRLDDRLAPRLVMAAAAIDPESLAQRHQLFGERPFGPDVPPIPDWLDKFDKFTGRDCFAGVVKAVLELGKWAGSRSTSDARGITGLAPSAVCAGSLLTISGSGFGAARPADTRVYVPTSSGGCREATVTQWSDTTITVQTPADIGPGCVGFVRLVDTYHEPQQVTGELTTCIGAVAEAWTRGFGRVGSPVVSCPPCLPGGQNRLQMAGRPSIHTFRFVPEHVEPNGQPVLSWNVSNAGSAQIGAVTAGAPPLALPSPLPLVGSVTLAPVGGLAPVTARYRLSAHNACGSASADAEFTMSRTPALAVTRIEVVQSIQKTDNSVRLTANRRTAVRVFVDSGIGDGFDVGLGPNRVGGVRASLLAESLDNGTLWNCGSPWPVGSEAGAALNRDLLGDSINFDVPLAACNGNVRFRAVVELPGTLGQPPRSSASGSVDVTFTPKPQQVLLPFLITDPSSASPAPTMADFFACTAGPASAQPFPDGGFTVNPPIPMTLSAVENLAVGPVWWLLVAKLSTMIFLFPSTPVGGIRVGIVPSDSNYPWGGMALPRVAVTVPSFLVQAGQAVTCTHELAHAFGLLHMNCGGPAGPYDGRLPLTISDPGLDVAARSLLPAGSNEAMTYCGPQWPSVEHWDHFFDSIPVS